MHIKHVRKALVYASGDWDVPMMTGSRQWAACKEFIGFEAKRAFGSTREFSEDRDLLLTSLSPIPSSCIQDNRLL